MKSLLRPVVFALLRLLRIEWILRLHQGYLVDMGWHRSLRERASVDGQGRPIPWIVYGATHLLELRVKPGWKVFEYGSGASTLWWASRVAKIHAVEHDAAWHARMAASPPANVVVEFVALGPDYPRAIERRQERWDVIVVDGRRRVECLAAAVPHLTDDGIIILDNSDREEYRPGIDALVAQGFRHLPFIGLSPGQWWSNQTSLFYRPGNILEL